jgi:hypothetical protein
MEFLTRDSVRAPPTMTLSYQPGVVFMGGVHVEAGVFEGMLLSGLKPTV